MVKPKEEPKIKFLLNGNQVNDRYNNPKSVLSFILGNIPNIEFWNPEAIKDLLIGTLDMTSGFAREVIKELPKKEVTNLRRFISWATSITLNLSRKSHNDFIEDEPQLLPPETRRLIHKIFNLVLAGEGLSVIPGFHYASKEIRQLDFL